MPEQNFNWLKKKYQYDKNVNTQALYWKIGEISEIFLHLKTLATTVFTIWQL